MILRNNFDYLANKKQLYFKGGGSSGDTYDAAYNARMATIAEAQQDMAEQYFDFWESDYKPMEKEQIAANREMIPYETGLQKEKIQAERELLPGQTAFTGEQIAAGRELLPGQTALAKLQMQDSTAAINERAPVRTAFYNEALNGIDVESRANRAAADAAHSFADSNNIMRRNSARMGVSPDSGRFTAMQNENSLDRAKMISGAKTQARTLAELENFNRLQGAMGVV
ncbi:MAG: hypothetical protein DRJ44_02765 [Thermoprotei archaeon]|nr:MAG: hypothetical protein DRJ44_02765 [Thermoprotei archaeon]